MINVNYSIRWWILLHLILVCKSFPDSSIIWFPNTGEERGDLVSDDKDQANLSIDSPIQCGIDEILYPDQVGFWVCDCKPGYVYYSIRNRCFSAYKRGPCAVNEYLTVVNNSMISTCVPNPCKRDNFVIFDGMCHQLNDPGICPNSELRNVLGVDKTITITCIRGDNTEKPTANDCPIGGIRYTKGQCPTQ